MLKKIKQINKEILEGSDNHLKDMLWVFWFGVKYQNETVKNLNELKGKEDES